ncbi:MAG TPA: universal stress protein [Mycobacterium sp.]|nr:universal stress protein [Mycobacterium sp.]HTQ21429.1 universal stress protein [Mycobacterium sp.]
MVGSRGHGALRGLLLGSVSTAMVYGAQCPVAVIPDREIPPPTRPSSSASTARRAPSSRRVSHSRRLLTGASNWSPCTRGATSTCGRSPRWTGTPSHRAR